MRPRIAAIVVNYNRADDTIACLQSLNACSYENLRAVIVDNGSTDGSENEIRSKIRDVEVLQTGKNLGFAAGNNVGIRRVLSEDPDYVLLINNDTLVEPDFLEYLVDALERHPDAAAAGGTICYHPERERVWYAGGRFIPWRASSFSFRVDEQFDRLNETAVRDVTFVTGCLMLLRTSALNRVGLFDERFFMYLEDAELSLRLIAAGYRLLYVPGARIYHKIRHQGDRPLPLYYAMRNRLLLVKLTTHGMVRVAASSYFLLTAALKMLVWRVWKPDLFAAAKLGLADYYGNVLYEGRGLSLASPRGDVPGDDISKRAQRNAP